MPRWARLLVLRYLAKLLCVRARKPKTMAANLDLTPPDVEDAADASDIKDGLRHVSTTQTTALRCLALLYICLLYTSPSPRD